MELIKFESFFEICFYIKHKCQLFLIFRKIFLFFHIFNLVFRIKNFYLFRIFEFFKIFGLFGISMEKDFGYSKKKSKKDNKKKKMHRRFFYGIYNKICQDIMSISNLFFPIFFNKKASFQEKKIFFPLKESLSINFFSLKSKKKKISLQTTGFIRTSDSKKEEEERETTLFGRKRKFKEIFIFLFSEIPQLKGWVKPMGKRGKNFCNIWNQSFWINNELGLKKKKNKEFPGIREEIFLINLSIQINKINLCQICLFKKNLVDKLKKKKNSSYLNWKIFQLEKKWSHNFSGKKKKILFVKHSGVSTDFCFDSSILIKKDNFETENLESFSFELPFLFQLPLRKIFPLFIPVDFFFPIFGQMMIMENFFLKKKSKIQKKKKIIKSDEICGKYNFWGLKCIDSFFPAKLNKTKQVLFLMSRRFRKERKVKNFVKLLFFQSFHFCPFKINPSGFREKNFNRMYQSFLKFVNELASNFPICCFVLPKSFNGIFFSQEKLFKYCQLSNQKIFWYSGEFENFNLVITGLYRLSTFLLWYFRSRIYSEAKSFQTEKSMLELEIFLKNHRIESFFDENPKNKIESPKICLIQIIDEKKGKKILWKFSFSVINFSYLREKHSFQLWIDFENFFLVFLLICIKFKTQVIFIKDDFKISQNLVSRLHFFFSQETEKNYRKGFKSDRDIWKNSFFSRIQIILLEPNSFSFFLHRTFLRGGKLEKKQGVLVPKILKILQGNLNVFSWVLSGVKRKKFKKFFLKKFDFSGKIFREALIFNLKRIFQRLQLKLFSIFFPKKEFDYILGFLCGFGPRLGEKLIKKKTKYLWSLVESPDRLSNENEDDEFSSEFKACFDEPFRSQFRSLFLDHPKPFDWRMLNSGIKKKNFGKLEKLNRVFKNDRNFGELEDFSNSYSSTSFKLLKKRILNLGFQNVEDESVEIINSKIFFQNWKKKILNINQIGEMVKIQPFFDKSKFFIKGKTASEFQAFLEEKNAIEFPLKFPILVKESFRFFQAKIVSVYQKISFIRLSLIPTQFISYADLKTKKILNENTFSLQEKNLFLKLGSYLKNNRIGENPKNNTNSDFSILDEPGNIFFWNSEFSCVKFSFKIDPRKKEFFSFYLEVRFDSVNLVWVFIYQKKIFFEIQDLVYSNFVLLIKKIRKLIFHENFFPGTLQKLQENYKSFTGKKEFSFFKFGFINKTSGKGFLFFQNSTKKCLTGFFSIEKEGFFFNGEQFSLFPLLKKFFLKLVKKKIKKLKN